MDTIVNGFAGYGLPGLVIAALIFACARLFARYESAQEKRIAESRESLKAIIDTANAIEANTEAISALGDTIRQRRE